jgi:hypothetical protein
MRPTAFSDPGAFFDTYPAFVAKIIFNERFGLSARVDIGMPLVGELNLDAIWT